MPRQSEPVPPNTPFLVEQIARDPVRDGWTIVETYGLYFWLPYLGARTYLTWVLIKSFAWGSKTASYPSVSRLARILSNSPDSRKTIAGRRGTTGTLQRLKSAGLLYVTTVGSGPQAKHTFHILRTLPLLNPAQLSELTPSLQRDHAGYLRRFNVSHEAYLDAVTTTAEGGAQGPRGWGAETQGVGPEAPGGGAQGPTNQHIESSHENTKRKQIAYDQLMKSLEMAYGRSSVFNSCSFADYKEQTLTIMVDSSLQHEILVNRFHQVVFRSAASFFPNISDLQFVCAQMALEGL